MNGSRRRPHASHACEFLSGVCSRESGRRRKANQTSGPAAPRIAGPEDWESWARWQHRRALLAVHLYDERTSGRESKTRCGLAAFEEVVVEYGPGRKRSRKLNVWSGSELSRQQDAASWERTTKRLWTRWSVGCVRRATRPKTRHSRDE